ncbi:hypothetical protein HMPREF9137_0722 [Prevotella denticola F0289]|nr:hypothetical protein HMPREF9137_0722 [Prevotella denticola F0289]
MIVGDGIDEVWTYSEGCRQIPAALAAYCIMVWKRRISAVGFTLW